MGCWRILDRLNHSGPLDMFRPEAFFSQTEFHLGLTFRLADIVH